MTTKNRDLVLEEDLDEAIKALQSETAKYSKNPDADITLQKHIDTLLQALNKTTSLPEKLTAVQDFEQKYKEFPSQSYQNNALKKAIVRVVKSAGYLAGFLSGITYQISSSFNTMATAAFFLRNPTSLDVPPQTPPTSSAPTASKRKSTD